MLAVLHCPAVVFSGPGTVEATPRQSDWFTASRVDETTWRIVDHGVVNSYLLLGQKRALLIDTGYGHANLRDYVRSITTLPLVVLNTHGHRDHSGGDVQFGAVLAHPADFAAIRQNATPEARARSREALGNNSVPVADRFDYAHDTMELSLKPLRGGDTINLGGRKLEVIATPGHTAGEIVLLDRQNKLLFAGDHINEMVWLQLPGCLPLETYRESLEKLAEYSTEFVTILPGHHGPLDAAYLAELTDCVEGILGGTIADGPYTHGQLSGRIAKHGRASVVFDPRNLRATE